MTVLCRRPLDLAPSDGDRHLNCEGMMSKQKDLVKIIRDNPGCKAVIDNDCWVLYAKDADIEAEPIASSDDDLMPLGDGGYGSGNCYGGDILQALAKIVGITVESV